MYNYIFVSIIFSPVDNLTRKRSVLARQPMRRGQRRSLSMSTACCVLASVGGGLPEQNAARSKYSWVVLSPGVNVQVKLS
jgi:hypothetical protein